MAVLETERLVLRPLTGDDFDDYAAMMADPQVADGLAEPIGRTPSDAWRNLALFEAARAVITYCFTTLDADEIISVIRPGNTRSIAVAERIGHRLLRETDYKNTPVLTYGQQSPTP